MPYAADRRSSYHCHPTQHKGEEMPTRNSTGDLENELQLALGRMTLSQAAHWVLRLISDRVRAVRSKCWWNPVALVAIKVLQTRAGTILEKISSGNNVPIEVAFRELEKTRWYADGLWAMKLLGQTFYVNSWYIYGLLAQFQCAYESGCERDNEYTKTLLQQMAQNVKKYAQQFKGESDAYLSEALRCANETLVQRKRE